LGHATLRHHQTRALRRHWQREENQQAETYEKGLFECHEKNGWCKKTNFNACASTSPNRAMLPCRSISRFVLASDPAVPAAFCTHAVDDMEDAGPVRHARARLVAVR
jgi:hypothetical protein